MYNYINVIGWKMRLLYIIHIIYIGKKYTTYLISGIISVADIMQTITAKVQLAWSECTYIRHFFKVNIYMYSIVEQR